MQYLNYIISQEQVQEALQQQESSLLDIFKETFSSSNVYKEVQENLSHLIVKDDVALTYSNIREFAQNVTLNYLNIKSKEISENN
jgi:hypothetical protein